MNMTTEDLQAIREIVQEVVREDVREIVQEEVREIVQDIVQEELREVLQEVVRETVQEVIEEEVGDIVGEELSGIEDSLSDLERRGAATNARLELVGKNLHILRKMLIQLDRRMGERFGKMGSSPK
jgi:predicted house-cleaning noncanonical NTP pyrophosphatase (MazG superfamily)